MQSTFFKELAATMADKQIITLTVTKVGDGLTLLVNKQNKLFTVNGTPEEVDAEMITGLNTADVKTEGINITVQDAAPPAATDSDEEEEEEETDDDAADDKKSTPAAKKSAPKAKAAPKKAAKPAAKKAAAQPVEDKPEVNFEKSEKPAKPKRLPSYKDRVTKLVGEGKLKEANALLDEADEQGGIPKVKIDEMRSIIANADPAHQADLNETLHEETPAEPTEEEKAETVKQDKFKSLMEEGDKLKAAKQFDDALAVYNDAKKLYPEAQTVLDAITKCETIIAAMV